MSLAQLTGIHVQFLSESQTAAAGNPDQRIYLGVFALIVGAEYPRRLAVDGLIAHMCTTLILRVSAVFLFLFLHGLHVESAAVPLAVDENVTGIGRMDDFGAATGAAESPPSLRKVLVVGFLHARFPGIEDRFADGVFGVRDADADCAHQDCADHWG